MGARRNESSNLGAAAALSEVGVSVAMDQKTTVIYSTRHWAELCRKSRSDAQHGVFWYTFQKPTFLDLQYRTPFSSPRSTEKVSRNSPQGELLRCGFGVRPLPGIYPPWAVESFETNAWNGLGAWHGSNPLRAPKGL